MILEINTVFNVLTVLVLGIQIPGIDGDPQCGMPMVSLRSQHDSSLGQRIVGGDAAMLGSLPWMVMLKKNGEVKCGGSILDQHVILTAAHCVDGETNLEEWDVYVGKHSKDRTDIGERRHKIERVIPHDQFDKDTLNNDIALLVLKERIQFSFYVQPICLPDPGTRAPRGKCYTAGWGDTKGTGHDKVLKQVQLDQKRYFLCNMFLRRHLRFRPSRDVFCAGYTSADACYGDSGGPYSCKIKGKWYIKGIVSSGPDCGQPGFYGIYVNVPRYKRWIKIQIDMIKIETLLPVF